MESETQGLDRRTFLKATGVAVAAASIPSGSARAAEGGLPEKSTGEHRDRIFKSIKFGMFREKLSYVEKFQLLKDLGYDGVELNSPKGENKEKALAASRELGFPIHGVVDSIHWGTRLSDPSEQVRDRAVEGLLTAVRESHACGGSAVLLVPGKVGDPQKESHEQVWERSIAGIRRALPLASRLGIHILIENVWNGFCYKHGGPSNQTAEQLAKYIDEIDSPWVGSYFDIGNHQKYGKPAEWIRTLGRRIVKLDVKDWGGPEKTFTKIGDGDVDWAAVRGALTKIGFTGWCTAEVRGGDRERIAEVADRMNRAMGL